MLQASSTNLLLFVLGGGATLRHAIHSLSVLGAEQAPPQGLALAQRSLRPGAARSIALYARAMAANGRFFALGEQRGHRRLRPGELS
jgi:hypothetical protein